MTLALVTWRDAHFWTDEPDRRPKDYKVRTVGWVKVEGRFVRIISEKTPDGNRAVTRVPLENVLSVERLETVGRLAQGMKGER